VGKFIPVEPEKWAEMVKAMAENARLKAEVERLKAIHSIDSIGIEHLKAEVERLSKKEDYQHDLLNQYAEDVERLKSELQMEKENEDRLVRLHQDARNEVERLKRAGDEMAHKLENYGNYYLTSQWEDAKEGNQS
jgi:predicted RNase H-like nuclease (RuvC/YqgF family)